jgi:hypothetical protein
VSQPAGECTPALAAPGTTAHHPDSCADFRLAIAEY